MILFTILAIERRRKMHAERTAKKREEKARLAAQAQAESDGTCGKTVEKIADELAGFRDQYFGKESRRQFTDLFRSAARDLSVYTADEDVPIERRTPRSTFLREQVPLIPTQFSLSSFVGFLGILK